MTTTTNLMNLVDGMCQMHQQCALTMIADSLDRLEAIDGHSITRWANRCDLLGGTDCTRR